MKIVHVLRTLRVVATSFLVLNSTGVWADSSNKAQCDLTNPSKDLKALQAVIDPPIDQSKDIEESCAVRNHNSKTMGWKSKVSSMVDRFVNEKNHLNTVFESLQEQKFDYATATTVEDQEDGGADLWIQLRNAKGTKDEVTLSKKMEAHRLSWLKNRYSESFIEALKKNGPKIEQLLRNRSCVTGANLSLHEEPGVKAELIADQEYKPGSPATQAAKQKLQKQIDAFSNQEGFVGICTEPITKAHSIQDISTVKKIPLEAASFFEDNQSELSSAAKEAFRKQLLKSLEQKPGCVGIIKSIQISTSANALANSSEVGRWNHLDLSKARANFLRDEAAEILSGAPNVTKLSRNHLVKITDIDFSGENGDGTSGPCPYRVQFKNGSPDGIQTLSATELAKIKTELKESKYGEVKVELDYTGPGCEKGKISGSIRHAAHAASKCFRVEATCE